MKSSAYRDFQELEFFNFLSTFWTGQAALIKNMMATPMHLIMEFFKLVFENFKSDQLFNQQTFFV